MPLGTQKFPSSKPGGKLQGASPPNFFDQLFFFGFTPPFHSIQRFNGALNGSMIAKNPRTSIHLTVAFFFSVVQEALRLRYRDVSAQKVLQGSETETKEFATRTKGLWVLDLPSEQVN